MSAQERAAFLRVGAWRLEVTAARMRLEAEVLLVAEQMRMFAEAWLICESREVATHPDVAELNVFCDGFYGEQQ